MKAASLLAVRPRLGEYPTPTRTQNGTRPSTTSTHRALVIAITEPGHADWSSRALRFLRNPPDDANLMVGDRAEPDTGSYSASHTINGHSINFRLRYRNINFMFTCDMNQQSMQRLREANPDSKLRSEILKCPHHGSADFDMSFLQDVCPVVSMISSGDESVAKEYIHPRATLMAALGRASRQTPSVIFCTELAAFFAYKGPSHVDKTNQAFEGFERLNFGIPYPHRRRAGVGVHPQRQGGPQRGLQLHRHTDGQTTFAGEVAKRGAPAR